jgi:hypothetical protein
MTFSIMPVSITTFSIMTFSSMTISNTKNMLLGVNSIQLSVIILNGTVTPLGEVPL